MSVKRPAQPQKNAERAAVRTLRSQLLAELISPFTVQSNLPLRVLDLGPASSASVAFLNQLLCTLKVVDLAPPAAGSSTSDELDEHQRYQQLLDYLRTKLDLPVGSQFDLCFFWDLLNQFDEQGVRALAEVLAPHFHASSRGHGFIAHSPRARLVTRHYGIAERDQLVVSESKASELLAHPHRQSSLNTWLGFFTVKRSVLHPDGRLEVLLGTASY